MVSFMTKFSKKVPYSLSNENAEHIIKRLRRPLLRAALFFISALFILSGCKKPEEEIGIELQSDSELLHASAVDTFSVRAYTIKDDSVRTDKLSPAIIGAFTDPIFGYTKAGHITQLRLTTNNPNLIPDGSTMDNIQVDSVILVLDYHSVNFPDSLFTPVYGNEGQQYFEVFELTDSLSVDSFYYENTPVNHTNEDWIKPGFNYQTPNVTDSVMEGSVKLPPQMRIPLREELADRFFEASANGELTATNLLNLIKGIYITVDETKFNTSDAGLISFDTFTGNSRITMFYSNILPDTVVSLRYSFAIRSNSAKYEHFEHDYSMAEPSLIQQLNENIGLGQQDLYVQGNSGTKIFLELPFIENMRDSASLAINQAKITIPVRGGDLTNFPPPNQLVIFPLDENGKIYTLQFDNPFNYGYYNKDKGSYEFLITRYLQQVLLGDREHYGFEIVSISSGSSANRVVLNGAEYPDAQNPSNNLKLAITFTKF